MNKTDNLYELSEIKNQFEKLQKKYQTQLPIVDPYLVYDLLLRQQKNPATIYMYNIEVFTKQGIDTNATKEHIYKKIDMVPAVYDKGTHYVTNQKLTLEILKEILTVNKYYKLVVNTQAAAVLHPWVHHMSLETREIPLNTVSMDKDMILDNNNNIKTIAVEQEEEKNIKHQKIRRIDFSFKREVILTSK
jgi:hypothetical protein